jgi:hypothetical protein
MINDLAIYLVNDLDACLAADNTRLGLSIGTRIVIRTSSDVEDSLIQMWQSCAVCEARTSRTNMTDGTL